MHGNVFYLNRDNAIEWQLKDGDVPLADHNTLTREVLLLEKSGGTFTIDSDAEATFFSTQLDRLVMTPFKLSAPKKAELTPGNYTARLVIYDAANLNGLVWVDGRPIKVIA